MRPREYWPTMKDAPLRRHERSTVLGAQSVTENLERFRATLTADERQTILATIG
jgi:hypothetical protein